MIFCNLIKKNVCKMTINENIFRIKMTDKRRLVFSVLKFLSAEMESTDLSDDAKESLEVK